MSEYLKDKQYYIDLYDSGTVEQCRQWVKSFSQPKNSQKKWSLMARYVYLYILKGERYVHKSEDIEKWMTRDRTRDEMLESAQPINDLRCLFCGSKTEVKDKSLRTSLDNNDKVLFLYSCSNCKKARFSFGSGEEYIPQDPKCPKCGSKLKNKDQASKDRIIYFSSCGNCDYKDELVIDLNHKEKVDPYFERDRKKYCMSDEDGKDYISFKFKMERMELLKKEDQKEKEIAEKTKHIKKLNITELEELLSKGLAQSDFVKFETSNPDLDKDIIISFTIHDGKKDRSEYDSQNQLKKAINTILENTNWHLMSDGVNYRLGILSGRLRGCDQEKDLLALQE